MLFIVGVPFLITLGGCTTAESSDLATSDISAEMHVEVDGEDTHIQAVLREGGEGSNTFVQLSGEDLLSINDGDRTLQLKE